MKVSGKEECGMEKEFRFGRTVLDLRGSGRTIKQMDRANFSTQMAIFLRVLMH
jgi:hypothetical protein